MPTESVHRGGEPGPVGIGASPWRVSQAYPSQRYGDALVAPPQFALVLAEALRPDVAPVRLGRVAKVHEVDAEEQLAVLVVPPEGGHGTAPGCVS